MTLAVTEEAPRVQVRDGRVVIDLDWDDADDVRAHFRRHGLPGTIRLDPATREARLELWDDPDPKVVREVWEAWLR